MPKEDASETLPFLWVIHDEFAEWMMTAEYGEAVSEVVSRLGVKARAAGIFLVFAAQRPDAHVMPMRTNGLTWEIVWFSELMAKVLPRSLSARRAQSVS